MSPSGVREGMERRQAADGRQYTMQEFQDHYGSTWEWHWERSHRASAHPRARRRTTRRGAPPRTFEGGDGAPAGRGAGAATPGEEPHADGRPPARDAAGADTPGEEPHARIPPHRTYQELRDRGARPGRGARHACQVQRALRAWCLEQQPVVYVVDLTNNELPPGFPDNLDFDWRDLLASMDPPVVEGLLEDSEVRVFSFRLLQGTLDHNWRKRDTRERHVFEMTLANGTTVHLHFHKTGRFDIATARTRPLPRTFPPEVTDRIMRCTDKSRDCMPPWQQTAYYGRRMP